MAKTTAVFAVVYLLAPPDVAGQGVTVVRTNAPGVRQTPRELPPLPPPVRQPAQFPPPTNRPVQRPQLVPTPLPAGIPGGANVPAQPFPLAFDAEAKEYAARPGETNAHFTFYLTNTSSAEVFVTQVQTSCGCTVAKVPTLPWTLRPGENGQIEVAMDLRGKRGLLAKSVFVRTSAGVKNLMVKANIPDTGGQAMGNRAKNLQIAAADRQAVFKNDCADCHAKPAANKMGRELYGAVCGICHDAEHRASMVPDLRNLNRSTDRIYWKVWITQGKAGSLMPAFAQAEGGPLSGEQISSLADYLAETISSRPLPAAPAAPAAASGSAVQ